MDINLTSREQAAKSGEKRFFTGEKCLHGHVTQRYVVNGGCVACHIENLRKFKAGNKEHVLAEKRNYQALNAEKLRAQGKALRLKNPEKVQKATAAWRAANPEHLALYAKKYSEANRGKKKVQKKARYTNDPLYRLSVNVRGRIAKAFQRMSISKSTATANLIGCDWPTLKEHIEKQFAKGMYWENKELWHIDHIVPLASAKTSDEIERLCHFTNLRPLWALENQKKNAKALFLI